MALKIFLSTKDTGLGAFREDGEVYAKDYIRDGSWVIKTPDGVQEFKVTPQRRQKWAETFQLMKTRGITVPLTVDHVQVRDPQTGALLPQKLTSSQALAKRGDVADLFCEADRGMCKVRLSERDTESRDLLQRCPEVSLELTKDLVDGHGNYYDEAITAITLTPFPVVPGQQQEWKKVAASRGWQESEVLCLSADPKVDEKLASSSPAQESLMDLAFIRKLFNIADTVKDGDLQTHLSQLVDSKKVLILSESGAADLVKGALKDKEDRIVALSRDLDAAKAAKAGIPAVDEDALEMAADAFKTRINALGVRATPNQKQMLLSQIVGAEGSRNVVMLSRKAAKSVGLTTAMADTVLAIFEAGDPAEMQKLLTENSKTQTKIELSRGNPDGGSLDYDPEITKRMIASANSGVNGGFNL